LRAEDRRAGHQPRDSVWDNEALEYIRKYYLKALRECGVCPKTAVWEKVQAVAAENNWRIGSRSGCYQFLSTIDPKLVAYALGGRRALDNYFYIIRDSAALMPFQVVIGDQHIFDYWVADYEKGTIQRPECYCWLDQHTKLIYGVAFAPLHYSSETVRDALKMGMYRFGRPDCLYNDNGSSECSKAFGEVADDLLRSGIRQKDISDLYKTEDGRYVILDKEEKDVVDVADTADEWNRKTRRRIFASRKTKTVTVSSFDGNIRIFRSPGKRRDPHRRRRA